ncbi:hypothetical protein LCGC14_1205600 [marine sediment metagenome]|uniref:Uncharacterized protein n=1 Tax=marine sediment metagenome TaxID=412755 RepID=A0A0F9LFG9_9ZZZZ
MIRWLLTKLAVPLWPEYPLEWRAGLPRGFAPMNWPFVTEYEDGSREAGPFQTLSTDEINDSLNRWNGKENETLV